MHQIRRCVLAPSSLENRKVQVILLFVYTLISRSLPTQNTNIFSKIKSPTIPTNYRKTFEALRVSTRDVEKIYNQFEEIDLDGSHSISIDEFFDHFELKKSKFSVRCFTIFDEDNSNELDFREFGVSLWNYCTQDHLALISFAFDLYDLDNSGSIDTNELTQMLAEVYGDRVENNTYAQNIKKKIKSYSGIVPGQISKPEFVKFAQSHPALLFPSFQVQRKLQQKAIGESFWNRLADKRFKAFGHDRIDINTIRTLVTSNGFIKLIEQGT